MAEIGWIRVHRALLDHWTAREPEAMAVWVRLLCEANFDDKKSLINGRLIDVKRGQLVFGRDAFSQRSGVSVMKLRRIMSALESDGMITQQKTNKFTLVSITCYEEFQQSSSKQPADNQQTSSKQPADNQQITTPKEVKKLRSEEVKEVDKKGSLALDYSSWPSMPSDILLAEWKSLRQRLKAGITQTVINRVGKELHIAVKAGFTVDQCFEQWIYKGWRGFEASWMGGNVAMQPQTKPPRAFSQ